MMCRRQTRPSVARDLDIALVADMKVVMLTSDKVTAEAWDEYMNRFGIEAYVAARYFSAPTSARIARDGPRHLRRSRSLRRPSNLGASIRAVNL